MTKTEDVPHDPHLRPARAADAFGLLQMVRALAAHHGDNAQLGMDQLIQQAIGSARQFDVLVAEQDGQLVGYAAMQSVGRLQHGQRGVDLHHLYVAEAMRGSGLGTCLIDAVQQAASRAGADYLRVAAEIDNIEAQGFYRKLGMEQKPVGRSVSYERAL
ncbi:MAG: GNAT family N-acetyltransferase [Rhodobacteraceae bacterium]|nr:GNAT family N-acetyltransferase [Paracoccaceae bacterium]